jgi:hypothetical protein|nr:MAG TPA: receptor binding protein [Caudoviricetes sp.]
MNGKNIFVTIEYVAKKILEAITGHKSDPQAHPNLSEQINVLSTERGYLNSKEITGVSIRTLTKNGTYAIDTNTCTDIPITNQGWAYLTVKANNDSYLIHELSYLNIPNATFKYKCLGGVWGEYENFATTTKTDISSSSLLNGWTMWGNGYGDNLVGCKTGKQVQLNGLLRCGVKTQNTLILTLPEELRPTCSIIKNVSCYPYGAATIEIQSVGNVLVGNIGEGTLAISMGDVSYSTL